MTHSIEELEKQHSDLVVETGRLRKRLNKQITDLQNAVHFSENIGDFGYTTDNKNLVSSLNRNISELELNIKINEDVMEKIRRQIEEIRNYHPYLDPNAIAKLVFGAKVRKSSRRNRRFRKNSRKIRKAASRRSRK